MSYSPVTVSGYNSSPPSDDGATDSSNRVTWAGIKTKLGDPIKTAVESINSNVVSAIATTDAYPATWAAVDATIRTELNAPAATAMLFVQTSAPTGWTKVTSHNDKALRLVSGTVSTGGSTAFSSVFTSRTITEANLPAHTHGVGTLAVEGESNFVEDVSPDWETRSVTGNGGVDVVGDDFELTNNMGEGNELSLSGATASTGSGTAMDFAVQYVDVIYATKN